MNRWQEALMDKPCIEREDGLCPFCRRPIESRHHIVPRSQGGHDGPTVAVDGYDNVTGCHGLLHHHFLHLDWRDGCWQYLRVETPCKFDVARAMDGWKAVVI